MVWKSCGKNKVDLNSWKKTIVKHLSDIGSELQRRALMESIDFVEKNLDRVKLFSSKYQLLEFALSNIQNKGLIMEFGVYKGDTINYISAISNKTIYGFDPLEELPEYWRDGYPASHFTVDNLPVVNSNVQLIKGWFNNSIPKFLEEKIEKCAFIHIDCDLYSFTSDIFNLLSSRIEKGTVIVFDEFFNYPGWKNGEYKAFMEYVNENNISFNIHAYLSKLQ